MTRPNSKPWKPGRSKERCPMPGPCLNLGFLVFKALGDYIYTISKHTAMVIVAPSQGKPSRPQP